MCKDSKYFSMSAMSKLLYGILADRNSLSMKNGWFDEENRIYFKFNQEELCDVLGVKDPKTLRKYLKELEKHELLFRKRMGAMLVDRLYLLQVESSETLINSMMGKNSLSRPGKNPYHDGENFPPSYTNNNYTNSISSSNSNEKETKEEEDNQDSTSKIDNDIKELLRHCQFCNVRLTKKQLTILLASYKKEKIIQAITTISSISDIKNTYNYIIATLNDMNKKIVINNKEQKSTKQKNKKTSTVDFSLMEQQLLELYNQKDSIDPKEIELKIKKENYLNENQDLYQAF